MSFGFVLIGLAGILYLQNDTKHKYISYVLFFYVLMELLQTVQYYLLNDCENLWNRLLTEVAYVHIILQPILWNAYFYANSTKAEGGLFKAGIALAIAWGVFNLLGRLLYGTPGVEGKTNSWIYGDKSCTYKGASHLYWQWTSADLGEWNATFIMYLLIWFVPALLSVTHFTTGMLIMGAAFLSVIVSGYMGDIREFPAAWCYISIPMLGIVIGKDALF